MNKKEIELHYLPFSIYGTDVLGFYHSTKSTEGSSSHSDTKVVASMVGVVLDMAQDGRPLPVVASSIES